MPACPDENELVRFARGALDEATGSLLSSHLDTCGSCRHAVAEAASDEPLPPPTVSAGARVGRYEVDALLGSGAMGAVFSARDASLHRRVAIKLLHTAGDELSRARLDREAQAMARLNHPHVVTVYELGDWTGGRFIAMELIEGKTLDAWLPGSAPSARRRILLDAGRGLEAAHRAGVVHRDFKPGNLLVGRDERVRVTDFGLSRPLPGADAATPSLLATQHGALVGTPAWMSPEQLDGKTAEPRSDQFAFCVVWVEALTGRKPFEGATREALRAAMKAVPVLGRELTAVERTALTRGLSEDPSARFESMEPLLTALTHQPRTRWPFAVGAALVLSLGGFGAWRLVPTAEPARGFISVDEGAMHTLEVKCIERVAVGDPNIADVKTLGNDELLIIGASAGATTLLIWDCEHQRFEWTVNVKPMQKP